jgi:hypothetical protein
MVKAYLTNSARYLDSVSAGDTLPSNAQGYGEVNLGTAFDNTPRLLVDQTELFQATAESYTLVGGIADPDHPSRVTIAWTDAPGPTTGAPPTSTTWISKSGSTTKPTWECLLRRDPRR